MTLAEKQQALVGDFSVIDDPQERLSFAIDRAKQTPPLSSADRIDANQVRGCISLVYLVGEVREGRCYFRFDADSPIVRALVALVCNFFNGATPEEIAASDADPVEALGLARNLSPTRRSGLAAVRAMIRAFAQRNATP